MSNRITKDTQTRRQEIIDAARGLFEAGGIQKTSMAEIAERVGVAKGLVYYYFASKDALVQAIVEQSISGVDSALTHIIADGRLDFYQKFAAFLGVYFQTIQGNPAIFSFASIDSRLFDLVSERLSAIALSHAGLLLEQGMALGLIDIEYPEYMLKLLIRGLVNLYMEGMRDVGIYVTLIEQTLGLEHGRLRLD
jgi:AcrR family transcriptional regulator